MAGNPMCEEIKNVTIMQNVEIPRTIIYYICQLIIVLYLGQQVSSLRIRQYFPRHRNVYTMDYYPFAVILFRPAIGYQILCRVPFLSFCLFITMINICCFITLDKFYLGDEQIHESVFLWQRVHLLLTCTTIYELMRTIIESKFRPIKILPKERVHQHIPYRLPHCDKLCTLRNGPIFVCPPLYLARLYGAQVLCRTVLRFFAVRCSGSLLYGAQVLCCTVLRFSAVRCSGSLLYSAQVLCCTVLRFSAVRCSGSLLYSAQVLCCKVLRFSAVQSGDIFGIKGLGMCSVVMRGGPVALIL